MVCLGCGVILLGILCFIRPNLVVIVAGRGTGGYLPRWFNIHGNDRAIAKWTPLWFASIVPHPKTRGDLDSCQRSEGAIIISEVILQTPACGALLSVHS